MSRDYFVDLYQYNDWANRRVWDCVTKVSDEDYFKDNTFSVGSIYTQLFHTLGVEKWWIGYLSTDEVVFFSKEDKERLKDRQLLRQTWDEINERNMVYMRSLTDEEIQRKVKVPWWDDDYPPITIAQALAQVANHSTDHRAQTMAVLHTYGYEGVGQDVLMYLHDTLVSVE
jgi:uncharacterized damage-inducible protein DinB